MLFALNDTGGKLAESEDAAAYYVATLWSDIQMRFKGDELIRYERELWLLGFDVSGRDAIRPSISCSRSKGHLSWHIDTCGMFWFPRRREGYRALWETLSCGLMGFDELADKAAQGRFDELEQLSSDIASLYAHVAAERRDSLPGLPNRRLGAFFAKMWVSHVIARADMDVMLDSYFSGVPAEYIVAA